MAEKIIASLRVIGKKMGGSWTTGFGDSAISLTASSAKCWAAAD
jgi:hypothetical protein